MKTGCTAVVLAAGMGTRLGAFTKSIPKALVPLHGKPILAHMLEALAQNGVGDVVVVGGYQLETLKRFCSDFPASRGVKIAINPDYAKTGTAASALIGIEAVPSSRDLLLIEGDVVCENSVLMRLLALGPEATVVEQYKPSHEGSFVWLTQGFVSRWLHARDRDGSEDIRTGCKTVNISYFSAKFRDQLVQSMRKVIALDRAAALEKAMSEIVSANQKVIRALVLSNDDRWWEVDNPDDLKAAEKLFPAPCAE
jgi:choline kinase